MNVVFSMGVTIVECQVIADEVIEAVKAVLTELDVKLSGVVVNFSHIEYQLIVLQ